MEVIKPKEEEEGQALPGSSASIPSSEEAESKVDASGELMVDVDVVPQSGGLAVFWTPKEEKPPTLPSSEEYQGKPPWGFELAWRRSSHAPYLYANCVYVIYAALILAVDLNPQWDLNTINNMFVGAAVVHVINAFMYIWVWIDVGFPFRHIIMIPECLNVLEATLYLCTAVMYRYEATGSSDDGSTSSLSLSSPSDDSFNSTSSSLSSSSLSSWSDTSSDGTFFDPILHDVQCIELTASLIEMLAAFGWVTSWYFTYLRLPGRGFTLDDPDIWANFTIVIAAVIYIAYNVQLQLDPSQYGADLLYVVADKMYMANALLYLMGSLRDIGWFWFMPTAGKFPEDTTKLFLKASVKS